MGSFAAKVWARSFFKPGRASAKHGKRNGEIEDKAWKAGIGEHQAWGIVWEIRQSNNGKFYAIFVNTDPA